MNRRELGVLSVAPKPARRAGLTAAPRHVCLVRVGPHRLRISRQGSGPPLLLIAGLGQDLAVWNNLVQKLPDFHTIAVDAPGTGSSTTPAVPLSIAELAGVYAALVRELGLSSVTVVGHSFGGAVAQQLAHQAPDLVTALVLCGTGPGIGGVPGSIVGVGELASSLWDHTAARARQSATLVCPERSAYGALGRVAESDDAPIFPPSIYGYGCQLAALVGWTSLLWLKSIRAPTLVIAGEEDLVTPMANTRMLGRLIPDAHVEVVTGGDHLFVTRCAQTVASLIRSFMTPRRRT